MSHAKARSMLAASSFSAVDLTLADRSSSLCSANSSRRNAPSMPVGGDACMQPYRNIRMVLTHPSATRRPSRRRSVCARVTTRWRR
eukprot:3715292-Pleurochrysis_carterae.AAC.5